MSKFKTKPFKHQRKALAFAQRKFFAYLMEQGTGKSKVIIDTAAELWRKNQIDMLVIIAPKGVALAWLRQQLPEHMPEDVPYEAALWRSASSMTKARTRQVATTLKVKDKLRIIIMNFEAFGATSAALDFAIEVLDSAQNALLVLDESHRIKTMSAHTTKRILNLRSRAAYRRILTGTVADKPFDVFPQFAFLDPSILETDSFAAFKSEYAEFMPAGHGLMRHIARRIPKVWKGGYIDDDTGQPVEGAWNADGSKRQKHMVPAYMPTIVAKNPDGTPRYKNLDKLQRLIAPHSYRVLKADCLDLPQKLYGRYYTELGDRQQALYNQVRELNRIEWEEGRITVFSKLTVYLRLQQIICGYLPEVTEDGKSVIHEIFKTWGENPRICSLLEYISDRPDREGTVIWCRFIEDIHRVTEGLRESYGDRSVVQFYGAVNERDRNEAVERFQGERIFMDKKGNLLRKEVVPDADRPRFMVAQQRAGGVGQTWIAANLSLHYSNTFSLIDRLQSEDRLHRIGQRTVVQYTDIEAEDTIDSIIIGSMIAKKNVADVINGDEGDEWLN